MTIDYVRQSLRLLARHKRFSALAIISLGLAIALNTTMYSVLDALISPKSVMREPDRLYGLQFVGDWKGVISVEEKNDALRQVSAFEALTTSRWNEIERVSERNGALHETITLVVAPNYFSVLGVRPLSGRLIGAVDNSGEAIVVSERFWKTMFADLPRFAPTTILLEGRPRTVVGVISYADFPLESTDVWRIATKDELKFMSLHLARLRPDFTPQQAAAELEVLRKRFAERTGQRNKGDADWRFGPATKPPFRLGNFHLALAGSVIAVLLIACANLANLQLARGVSRARELATRSALGASRSELVRQLLIESGWLALGGLILGAMLTAWGIGLVDAHVPPLVAEYIVRPQVTWRVTLFAVMAMLVCLVLVGLAPAMKLSRVDISELMKAGAGTGKSRGARRQYGALVVAEVALALAVLCSASILVSSALAVTLRRPEVDDQGLVFAFVGVVAKGPTDMRSKSDWREFVLQRAMAVPGITNAATRGRFVPRHHVVSLDDPGGTPVVRQAPLWWYQAVSPDYLRTMRVRVVQGRDFSPGEFAEPSVIVDRRTAATLWPGTTPVGRLIKLDSANGKMPWMKVIGVAENIGEVRDNDVPRLGDVYVLEPRDKGPLTVNRSVSRYGAVFGLVVRGNSSAMKAAVDLYRGLGNLGDGRSGVGYPMSWDQQAGLDRLRAKHQFIGTLFLIFGVLALGLAALGVYATVAHAVSQRTREFGVRMAVGAGARDIRQLVLSEANVLTLSGIAIGLLGAIASARLVAAFQLRGFEGFAIIFFAAMCVVLFIAVWIASYIPARRAMRINPVEALRND